MAFSVPDFIEDLGRELIAAYERGGSATSPGAIGAAREGAVRQKLAQAFSGGVGIGTGFVIDSQGNVSKQQDVILYEKSFCPVYRINEVDEVAYYPCEGVFAVGEVKSTIGSVELDDILEKIASVRKLRRHISKQLDLFGPPRQCIPFRHYGVGTSFAGTEEEDYVQDKSERHQVYGFAIGRTIQALDRRLATLQERLDDGDAVYLPNLIVGLEQNIGLVPYSSAHNPQGTALGATYYRAICPSTQQAFLPLVQQLSSAFSHGVTTDLEAYRAYLARQEGS